MGRDSKIGSIGRTTTFAVSCVLISQCIMSVYSHPDLTAAITSWGEGWVIMLCTGISWTGGSLKWQHCFQALFLVLFVLSL